MFQLIFNILNALWDQGEVFSSATRIAFFKSLKYSYCFWPFFDRSVYIHSGNIDVSMQLFGKFILESYFK